jgi:hypothetical protein
MRALREIFARTLWGGLDDRRRHGLVHLFDVISETPLHNRFWMNGGLLLGCIRCGGPLPHDDDADFSYWKADREKFVAATAVLKKHGFSERKTRLNNDGTKTKWAFRYRGVKYEFYEMEPIGDRMRWLSHARAPQLELVNEVPMHGLDVFELYGRRWMKPDDHETYLRSLYGDWRTPNKNYCYWNDSQAVVARLPWKETA